jgi:hypothetical protein
MHGSVDGVAAEQAEAWLGPGPGPARALRLRTAPG